MSGFLCCVRSPCACMPSPLPRRNRWSVSLCPIARARLDSSSGGLPRNSGGSASALPVSRPAQRSLALRPARSPSRRVPLAACPPVFRQWKVQSVYSNADRPTGSPRASTATTQCSRAFAAVCSFFLLQTAGSSYPSRQRGNPGQKLPANPGRFHFSRARSPKRTTAAAHRTLGCCPTRLLEVGLSTGRGPAIRQAVEGQATKAAGDECTDPTGIRATGPAGDECAGPTGLEPKAAVGDERTDLTGIR